MTGQAHDDHSTLTTLANGVRVVTLPLPHAQTAGVGVFVRTGSAHESRAHSGISHFVEHMVFKGTRERDSRRINLDAERLGAEVNAHTDKDHTAFHMRGLGRHAGDFVRMLGDIVREPTFPEAELERERDVLLHEFTETEEDPMATAFALFDRACYGLHPVAQPVIGTRRNIERIGRADLVDYVVRRYTGANVVVGAAGQVDPQAIVREVDAVFGSLPRGDPNLVEPPAYLGDVKARRLDGSSQTHLVLGFPIGGLADDDPTGVVAAALFGEGMSSPLLEQVRERRGLAYYAACSADVYDMCGQFVVEASIAPDKLDEFLREVMRLVAAQADAIDPVDLERAHNQIAVRWLRDHERPLRRLEDAALDLFVHGRLRSHAQRMSQLARVSAHDLRTAFARMLAAGPSLAITGKVARGAGDHAREIVGRQPA
jgi:predicted Zn-dependent peptidase